MDGHVAVGCPHEQLASSTEQVAALNEFDPHPTSQEGVLEVRGVVDAGGEYDNGWVGHSDGSGGPQGGKQLLGVLVHGEDAILGEERGEGPGHRPTVLHDIGDSRRDPHIVLEYPEMALLIADHVDAGHLNPDPIGRADTVSGSIELGR